MKSFSVIMFPFKTSEWQCGVEPAKTYPPVSVKSMLPQNVFTPLFRITHSRLHQTWTPTRCHLFPSSFCSSSYRLQHEIGFLAAPAHHPFQLQHATTLVTSSSNSEFQVVLTPEYFTPSVSVTSVSTDASTECVHHQTWNLHQTLVQRSRCVSSDEWDNSYSHAPIHSATCCIQTYRHTCN